MSASALGLVLAAVTCGGASALTPHLLGNFSVTNPSFLLLDNFGGGPINLVRGVECVGVGVECVYVVL